MPASDLRHSSACASARRHRRRHVHAGTLDIATLDVAARLLVEGVPATDVYVVAAEVERCVRILGNHGDDALFLRLHPWTVELIERYGDKLRCLLMTTRGK